MISRDLEEYIEKNSSPESELLYQLNRETHLKLINPRMLSGHIQGKFLEMVSHMIRPTKVLEIGTFTGYSAICLCAGLQKGGRLISIDINEELGFLIDKYHQKAGLAETIDVRFGNALDLIPGLDEDFDLVFIDADKENYQAYYELVKTKLSPGGFILIDNTLWGGKVFDASQSDETTNKIKAFNQMITDDPETENVMLSIRDGLTLVRKC